MQAEGPVRLVVEIGLIVILSVIAARLLWLLLASEASVATYEDRPLPTPTYIATSAITGDRSLLVRLNPFEDGIIIDIPDAPETQLNLRLAGLIMSTDAFGGSAQITTPDNLTKRYTSGSEVLPGVILDRVLSDRVILSRNGETETLMLSGRGEGLSVISDGSQVVTSDGVSDDVQANAPIEREIASPADLLSAVIVAPIERDGQTYGYQLSARGSADVMATAGLLPDDVLTEINGTSVLTLDLDEIITEIGSSSVAVLQLERDGNTQVVRLSFDEG